jgi:hypothetical protein
VSESAPAASSAAAAPAASSAASGAVGRTGRPHRGRRMRGLLVTPWFAAGAGILIAATLALGAPRHAVLSYAPIDPGVLCKNPRCATAVPTHAPGSLAGAQPGIALKVPKVAPAPAVPAPAPAAQPSATPRLATASDIAVHYVLLRHQHGGFLAVISVQSRQKLGSWTLGFTIPGVAISDVWGARWQPSASGSGGVASGQPWPWPRSGPGMAKIVIFATGRPRPPTGCTFNGQSCAFS